MAQLLHEVWEVPDEQGQWLPSLQLAGPDGDAARTRRGPGARLVTTLRAGSHFEAMTRYYALQEWGAYTTHHAQDYWPYPDEWALRQGQSPVSVTHLKVRWHHWDSRDPVLLYCELDVERHEVRKVHVYADGRMAYAQEGEEFDDCELGAVETPSAAEIDADPEFEVLGFDALEFERAWSAAVAGQRWPA
ncbi:DUF6881 domain-containing protein [Roseateles chitinivorans]|uniref:DUF6881 domain-containing protein n=1 Tax=Roseateles chitinivorans TaxID=2917965 RepID=UPI003D66FBCB